MSTSGDEQSVAYEQTQADWVNGLIDARIDAGRDHLARADPKYRAAQARTIRNQEDRLIAARQSDRGVIFGRVDFAEDPDYSRIYIGQTTVEDLKGEAVVADWQAPVAKLFYESRPGQALGIGRRRTIAMRRERVKSVSDDVLTPGFRPIEDSLVSVPPPGSEQAEPATPPTRADPTHRSESPDLLGSDDRPPQRADEPDTGFIRAKDLLLEELERDRDGKMRDAVVTLQAEQYRLISADTDRPLIIQGGPGTGKTVVALHRASWVLYQLNESGITAADCLVVGPNTRFAEYISQVLPSLGRSDILQSVIDDIGLECVPNDAITRVKVSRVDSPEAARIKGSNVMGQVLERALWNLGDSDTTLSRRYEGHPVTLSAAFFTELKEQIFEEGLDYEGCRQLFLRRCGELVEARVGELALAERLASRNAETIDDLDPNTAETLQRQSASTAAQARDAATQQLKADVVDKVFPKPRPYALVRDIFTRRRRLSAAGAGLLTRRELDAVVQGSGPYEWTAADIALVDEAAAIIGIGIRRYSHVVIDEAQDLSPIQWRMVRRRARGDSITAVGDLAQGTAAWSPERWDRVLEANRLTKGNIVEMTLGYRVPQQILRFANQLLPLVASDLAKPRSLRQGTRPQIIEVAHTDRLDAVVSAIRDLDPAGTVIAIADQDEIDSLRLFLTTNTERDVLVLTPVEAKGLEFDHVVVLDPRAILERTDAGPQQLYIACTRPTKTLTLISLGELPEVLRPRVSSRDVSVLGR